MVDSNKLGKSFGYAFSGFSHTLSRHQNMRIHMTMGAIVLVLAAILRVSRIEFLVLAASIFLVLFAEMVNTAIEETLNAITAEHKAEIKIAKDVAAAAVLLTSIFSVIVGIVIFVPYFFRLF